MAHVLLIDDDLTFIPNQVRQLWPAPAHRVGVAGTGGAGLEQVRAAPPDVILLDLRLPDQSGLEVYRQIRQIDARIPVIFITTAKMADAAIEAMKQGAYDYLFKPLDLHQLQRVVGEALDVVRTMRTPAVVTQTPPEDDAEGAIIGGCPAMREVYKAIGRVAAQNVPVLITGESGTGKELVARALYQHSPRARAPFLALNCAAIPESLLESELFGHEKGAFTGADRKRIGKFEQVSGGTIFLDEIGDMPLALQAKMLRLLQEQTFERVGGSETVQTDVRLIAATHRDLKGWSEEGKFRPDLYYRLNVFTIHLPPLRERCEDLPPLVQHYLRRFSRELGREVREIAPEALARLRGYGWPGNIRELQSVLKQALLRASGTTLLPAFLPAFPGEACGPEPTPLLERGGEAGGQAPASLLDEFLRLCLDSRTGDLYADAHRQLDRLLLTRVLGETGGNQQQAARRLGISRDTLRRRLRELGLQFTRQLEAEDDDQA
jgi:two-component system nitrogen regulation response regulator GlnG